jgi:hypothetical protein
LLLRLNSKGGFDGGGNPGGNLGGGKPGGDLGEGNHGEGDLVGGNPVDEFNEEECDGVEVVVSEEQF